MKRTTLVSLSMLGVCAFGDTWVWQESGQADRNFSSPANWASADRPGTAPISNPKGTRLEFAAVDGATFVNDFAPYLGVYRIEFKSDVGAATITGNPLFCGNDYLTGYSSGKAGQAVTFDVPIYAAASNGCTQISPAAGRAFYFKKQFRSAFEEQDATASSATASSYSRACIRFQGAGTNFIDGGIYVPHSNSADNYAQWGHYGSGVTMVRSDVYVPSFYLDGGGKIVITDGATLYTTGSNMSFLRNGAIEIENGAMYVNNAGMAQLETGTVVLNVRANGIFDTGAAQFRSGNDGMAIYNVYDGGTIYWRFGSNSAEKGASQINVYGGRFVTGDSGKYTFRLGRSHALQLPKVSDEMLLAGGEFHATGIKAIVGTPDKETRKVYIHLDGGAIVAHVNCEFITYEAPSADNLVVDVRAGGMKFDTAGHDVSWSHPLVASSVGGATGAIVKRARARLRFPARFSSTPTLRPASRSRTRTTTRRRFSPARGSSLRRRSAFCSARAASASRPAARSRRSFRPTIPCASARPRRAS